MNRARRAVHEQKWTEIGLCQAGGCGPRGIKQSVATAPPVRHEDDDADANRLVSSQRVERIAVNRGLSSAQFDGKHAPPALLR